MPKTQALSSDNVSGWWWSSNIGWISMNCTTGGINGGDICASSSYGVTIDNTTHTMTGWAWSDNIGWIKFGGLSGWPTGGGTFSGDARLNTGTNTLEGWARACSGTTSGNCSTMSSRTDGWEGWIRLSGSGYGITLSGTNFAGYGWGSDVVGWINASQSNVTANGLCGTNNKDTDSTATISWNITNTTANQCTSGTLVGTTFTQTNWAGNSTNSVSSLSGSTSVNLSSVPVGTSVTYAIQCNSGVYVGYDSINRVAQCLAPTASSIDSFSGSCMLPSSTSNTFTWSTSNVSSCSISATPSTAGGPWSVPTSSTGTSLNPITIPGGATSLTFTLSCVGTNNSVSPQSISVPVSASCVPATQPTKHHFLWFEF